MRRRVRTLLVGGVLFVALFLFAYYLVREVLGAPEGTEKMKSIARAIQDGWIHQGGRSGGAGPGAQPGWRWDVALSFAGAQREYVERAVPA